MRHSRGRAQKAGAVPGGCRRARTLSCSSSIEVTHLHRASTSHPPCKRCTCFWQTPCMHCTSTGKHLARTQRAPCTPQASTEHMLALDKSPILPQPSRSLSLAAPVQSCLTPHAPQCPNPESPLSDPLSASSLSLSPSLVVPPPSPSPSFSLSHCTCTQARLEVGTSSVAAGEGAPNARKGAARPRPCSSQLLASSSMPCRLRFRSKAADSAATRRPACGSAQGAAVAVRSECVVGRGLGRGQRSVCASGGYVHAYVHVHLQVRACVCVNRCVSVRVFVCACVCVCTCHLHEHVLVCGCLPGAGCCSFTLAETAGRQRASMLCGSCLVLITEGTGALRGRGLENGQA